MSLLGIDLGSSHIKAGIFKENSAMLALARRQTPVAKSERGYAYFDPEEFWRSVVSAIQEVSFAAHVAGDGIKAAGITSMAESGLFIDAASGAALTPILPWFETSPARQVAKIVSAIDRRTGFLRTGIYPSFKVSLAKILWLMDEGFTPRPGDTLWLSTADYILSRLTASAVTDASLAGRTYAFRIDTREWDADLLERLGLSSAIFPRIVEAGSPAGRVHAGVCPGLPGGIPVAVCGHDHICASFAGGLLDQNSVFDSMGTAETVTGLHPHNRLGEAELLSGLSFGCHVLPGRLYWLGGLSTSGAAVEWMRRILGDPPPGYADLDRLISTHKPDPAGPVFLPYLAGSGSPHTAPGLKGAFLGLDSGHIGADLYHAVLTGISCEMEFIREAGKKLTGHALDRIIVAGGGSANRPWLQVKADITGCTLEVFPTGEASALGAALLAGVGTGCYHDASSVQQSLVMTARERISPRPVMEKTYQKLFDWYQSVQVPYRQMENIFIR